MSDLAWALEVPAVNDDLATFTTVDAEAFAIIHEAARNWQTLTNPTDEVIEQVAATLYTQKWGPSMSGARPGAKERETAYAVLHALSDTAEPEILPPNPGRDIGPQTEN